MDKLFAPPEKPIGSLGRLYERFHRNLRLNHRTVGIVDVRDWAEEAEQEIARLYGIVLTESYPNSIKNQEYTLPADCLTVDAVKMTDPAGRWDYDVEYGVTENSTIFFAQDGDFTLVYKKNPAPLEAELTENLSTDTVFHRAIDHYVMYRYYQLDAESPERDISGPFLQRFHREIARSAEQLTDRPKRFRRVRKHY